MLVLIAQHRFQFMMTPLSSEEMTCVVYEIKSDLRDVASSRIIIIDKNICQQRFLIHGPAAMLGAEKSLW